MPVTVNPASKITAAQWVAMIKKNPGIPDFVRKGFKARGNVITATIKQPALTTPKIWTYDLVAAYDADEWEITTARATFEIVQDPDGVHVRRRIFLDLQAGEFGPGLWLKTGPGTRSWAPDNRTLNESYKVGEIALEFGETFTSQVRLKSRRPRLIIIVNVITVFGVVPSAFLSRWFPLEEFLVTSRQFNVPETRLLSSFLHELAAHAGRIAQNRNADHKNPQVEADVEDIERLFPEDTTLMDVAHAVREAANRLKELEVANKRVKNARIPGPGARTPGPLRYTPSPP